jgi:hypothetical protein
MKTIKTIFLILFLFACIQLTGSEVFRGDTVRISIGNILVEVSSCDLKVNTVEKADIPGKVTQIIAELKNVEINPPGVNERIKVRLSGVYKGGETIYKKLYLEKEAITGSEVILTQDERLYKGQGKYLFEFEDLNYLIRIFLEEIGDAGTITQPEFVSNLKKADTQIPPNREKTNGWLILGQENEFRKYFLRESPPVTSDMIVLTAGIGSGIVKNQFVSDINFRIGLTFGKKATYRNIYFADYEIMYDFSQGSTGGPFQTNHFLSFGLEHNKSLNPEKDNWYGLSFGYLLNANSNFFEKNTYRFRLHKRIYKTFMIIPELYFNDFFKDVYPGIRFNVTF